MFTLKPFRMYVNMNCPHCQEALALFKDEEVEVIVCTGDPLIQAGLNIVSLQQGVAIVPFTYSYASQESIIGADIRKLRNALSTYRASPGSIICANKKAALEQKNNTK